MLDVATRQAARRARLQARGRPLRPAHLPPHLPGHAREGRHDRQHAAPARRSRSAASCACTPTRWRTSTGAGAGDIVALFGIDCDSGDTFTDGTINVAMTSMHVPEPVISLAHQAQGQQGAGRTSRRRSAASRKEDPTFRVARRPRVERDHHRRHGRAPPRRLHRAHEARVQRRGRDGRAAGRVPRDHHASSAEFNYTHKKQTGGSGQYGRVAGYIEPLDRGRDFEFVDEIRGGSIPREFIPSCEKGFKSMIAKGRADRRSRSSASAS